MSNRSVKQGQQWSHAERDLRVTIADETLLQETEPYCLPVWIHITLDGDIDPTSYSWLSVRSGETYITRTELLQAFEMVE